MLIDQENDSNVLNAIKTLLVRTDIYGELRQKLSERAQTSNKDIQAGRLLTRQELEEQSEDLV